MSLPVTRRIARAALLIAAGAAPVVAAAGSASAVSLPPQGNEMGGLSTLDSASTGKALDSQAQKGVGVVNATGNEAERTLAPALVRTLAPAVVETTPVAQDAAHRAEGMARPIAQKGAATEQALPEEAGGLLGRLVVPAAQTLIGGVPVDNN
ncbi:ATP-binding protein [Streptomyces sp. GS7]|uniref:ATP-binding protein n=1 Tax=Streptomyces sp. GS7 TaxID=2692234 RepID=UPI0013171A50|nr:ATP-binding protein [Streptomyces sp. GS7]QHC25596.1 ATP-binding protein [Streptomyces sp. GS7]